MGDRIEIRDLRVRTILGVHPEERETPREIGIDLVLFADVRRAGESDALEDTVDYAAVVERVTRRAREARRRTLEALATDLAGVCLEFRGVERVRVRVEKPGALPDVRSVAVEIERS